jgi:hypothetical protein
MQPKMFTSLGSDSRPFATSAIDLQGHHSIVFFDVEIRPGLLVLSRTNRAGNAAWSTKKDRESKKAPSLTLRQAVVVVRLPRAIQGSARPSMTTTETAFYTSTIFSTILDAAALIQGP